MGKSLQPDCANGQWLSSAKSSICRIEGTGPLNRENSPTPLELLQLKMPHLVRNNEGDSAKEYKRNEPNH